MAEEKSEATPRLERGLGAELHPLGNMARVVIGTIVVAGLYFARPVLEPIALAVLLSLLLALLLLLGLLIDSRLSTDAESTKAARSGFRWCRGRRNIAGDCP